MFRLFSVTQWQNLRILVLVALCTALAFTQALVADWQPAVSVDTDAEGIPLPIVMYHGISEDPAALGDYVISPSQFEADLTYLQQAGYTTVTVADLIAYVDEGVPLPDRAVMLTFDDGYYNNYRYAYPLLQQYGMRAVISPIARWSEFYSDHIDQQDRPAYSHITWEQMRRMTVDGTVEIQCHSYDMHYNDGAHRKGASRRSGESADRYREALRQDITRALELMRTEAGITPTTFAYPFGAISKQTDEVLREMGFRATLGCESRMNRITRDVDCLYRLGRFLRPHRMDSVADILE